MSFMFSYCWNFRSDLSKWDTSKVDNMRSMFTGCVNFNSDLSEWDISNVENMEGMFEDCTNFDCDLSKWNPKKLRFYNLQNLFHNSGMTKIPKWFDTRSTPGVL